ncbi:hypothetical protein NDU88_002298 [Pleurodeles waltl]|uniref:Uncharacterized protein n=1 Tax=Pleurodeles waltl TaxID=8319 RepID=A0AAV7RAI8_PLEWA|nr:hypothetical protein NDU88_002298 [Pleurodeles waltl]
MQAVGGARAESGVWPGWPTWRTPESNALCQPNEFPTKLPHRGLEYALRRPRGGGEKACMPCLVPGPWEMDLRLRLTECQRGHCEAPDRMGSCALVVHGGAEAETRKLGPGRRTMRATSWPELMSTSAGAGARRMAP